MKKRCLNIRTAELFVNGDVNLRKKMWMHTQKCPVCAGMIRLVKDGFKPPQHASILRDVLPHFMPQLKD